MRERLHVILVAFNNQNKTKTRWNRDILPALAVTDVDWIVTCVDNSDVENPVLRDAFKDGYLWQEGRNLQYGPSINLAVKRIPSDCNLYACSQHGKMIHPGWINDLLHPLRTNPKAAMTGWLMGSNSCEGVAHDLKQDWIREKYRFGDGPPQHIQGGVWAARTDALLKHPYPDSVPHNYSDHVMTWELLKAGYECIDVPTVKSVWRCRVWEDPRGDPTTYKFIHDNSED